MRIKPEQHINVGIVYNAFDPTDVVKDKIVYRKNVKLKTYLADLPTDCDWAIGVNGMPVDLALDGDLRLKPEDTIQLVVIPHGDEGVKSVLRIAIMVGLTVAAAALTAGMSAWAQAAIMATTAAVGGFLVNTLIPPVTPKADKEDQQSYGYDGAKNTIKQGVPIPVVYGMYRAAGNYVDVYTQNVGDDQYLFGRTVLSDGVVESISDAEVNDQPINNYSGVDFGSYLGEANQGVNPYFNRSNTQINKGIKLSTAWTKHTTTAPVEQIELNVQFPRGLCSMDDKGKKKNRRCSVAVEYTETGTNNWRPLGTNTQVNTDGVLNGATPQTTKLAVTAKPVLSDTTKPIPYSFAIQYRLQGSTEWKTHKTVSGYSNNLGYVSDAYNWAEINSGNVTYNYQANETSYEWAVPQGAYEMRITGDATMLSWGYIESTPFNSTITYTDKRVKTIRHTISSGKLDLGRYDIQIRKLAVDGDNEKDVDEMYLTDVGEITYSGITLNHVANAYFRIKMSEQLNGIPNITWLVKGVKVNHYDRKGNVTKKAWTDNPAWIVLDMLESEERGIPGLYKIDYAMFLEWADFCEANGLKFNGIFDTTTALWDACQEVLKVGHACFTRIGTKLSLAIDRPQEPVMLFGPGNIYKGSFKVSYLPLTGRANEFEFSYYDNLDGNKQKTIRITDPDAENRGDMPRAASSNLQGVNNYEQAYKEAWYALYNNRYMRRTITFDAPIESIGLVIGDVALIQHDMMDWGVGGRLAAGSTPTVIKLDRPVTMEAGKQYSLLVTHDKRLLASGTNTNYSPATGIMTIANVDVSADLTKLKRVYQPSTNQDYEVLAVGRNGTTVYLTLDAPDVFAYGPVELYDTDVIEERDVVFANGATQTITLQSALSSAPSQYINFMFGVKEIVKKPYRLKSINGTGFDKRSLTFTEYNSAVYNPPEIIVPAPPTTQPRESKHVTELRYAYDARATDVNTAVNGILSWRSDDIANYGGVDIYVALNGADFVFNKTVLNVNECQLGFHFSDEVRIKVVAFNTNLVRAAIGTAPSIDVTIQAGPTRLDPPTDLAVRGISYIALGVVEATWVAPLTLLDSNIKYRVQVNQVGTDTWDEYAVTSETILRIGDLETGNYQVRVRTERGEAYSTYITKAFTVNTVAGETVEKGATVGAPSGTQVGGIDVDELIEMIQNGGGTGPGPGQTDITPPAIPTNLVLTSEITDSGSKVIATWTPPSDGDLVGYDISIKEAGGSYIDFTTTTPRYEFKNIRRNVSVTARVRAFDKAGNRSGYTQEVSLTTAKDNIPPAKPTNLAAEAAFNTINLVWLSPSDADLSFVKVRMFNGTTDAFMGSRDVNTVPGAQGNAIFTGLSKATTYKFTVEAYDTSGNASGQTPAISIATAGGIVAGDFTPGLSPIATVATLPNPAGYTGPTVVFNQADRKLYRYDNGVWKSDADIADNSITNQKLVDGTLDITKFNQTTRPVEVVNALPTTGNFEGRIVVFGGKLYRFTGSAYTTKVESTDVNGKFTRESIAANTITSNEIAANTISTNKMLISDTLNYTENYNFDFGNVGWILQNNRGAASIRSRDDIGAGNTYNGSRYVGYTPFYSETVYRNKGHLSVKPGDELYAYVLGHLTNGTAYSRISYLNVQGNEIATSHNGNLFPSIGNYPSEGGWQKSELVSTVPLGASYARVECIATTEVGEFFLGAATLNRRNTGELLVDGIISASKIKAGAVEADKIAANAISANKLMVSSRPVSLFNLRFYVANDGKLNWESGYVQYVNSNGSYTSEFVAGGSAAPSTVMQFIYYAPNSGVISLTAVESIQANETVVLLGQWGNTKATLTVRAGVGTYINGGQILTESIHANRITAKTITANEIAAGTITAAQIATGALTARTIAVGNPDSIVGDSNFQDASWWSGGVDDPRLNVNDSGMNEARRELTIVPNGGIDVTSMFFPAEPGATYRVRVGVYTFDDFSGSFAPVIHVPGMMWYNLKAGVSYGIGDGSSQFVFQTPGVYEKKEFTVVNGNSSEQARWQFRLLGSWTGKVAFTVTIVRMGDATLITDGAIETVKIKANAITADKILAGAITAGKIAAEAITTDKLSLGVQSRTLNNLLNTAFWGTGSITGQTNWSENNGTANYWAHTSSPGGGSELALRMVANTTEANGGWNVSVPVSEGFSPNKAYRYYTWYKAEGNGKDNTMFHGCDNVQALNGGDIGNPYFFSFNKSSFTSDKWYLLVGYIHPAGSGASNSGFSGIYDPVSGERVLLGSDYRWRPGATYGNFRSYQFYGGEAGKGGVAWFTKPVVEEVVQGQTPSIRSLMNELNLASAVNVGTTMIRPGLIQISGTTTIEHWKNGADSTEIKGGAIAANTISANKLTIGNRGINIINLQFRVSEDKRYLYWSAGHVSFQNDDGITVTPYVGAGGTDSVSSPGSLYYYIYWKRGESFLNVTYDDPAAAMGDDKILLCTWVRGTSAFNANYGGTIIHGDEITTGTINADRIKANTILASSVVISGSGGNTVADALKKANWDDVSGTGKPENGATVGAPAGTNVGGQTAANVAAWSSDPAARVNANTTTISGGKITTGSITADQIAANTITATKLNVTSLSAISANIGTVTAGLLKNGNGTSTFDLDNGRIIFNNGSVMKVTGVGFGSSNQFIEWFGPVQSSLANCTEANAISYLKTNGSGYFGGSLSAGVIKNAAQTTSIASNATVTTGPVGSNGGARRVVLSYSYNRYATYRSTAANVSGGGSAVIVLYKNGAEIGRLNATGDYMSYNDGSGNKIYEEGVGGSLTVTDTSGGTNVEYSATLISRSVGPGPTAGVGSTIYSDTTTQGISIVQTEG